MKAGGDSELDSIEVEKERGGWWNGSAHGLGIIRVAIQEFP